MRYFKEQKNNTEVLGLNTDEGRKEQGPMIGRWEAEGRGRSEREWEAQVRNSDERRSPKVDVPLAFYFLLVKET
ncbi:hypothetical protein E2C01_028306 [Portunus trituberculatus]|uniref:Uncharacterized protein n=1 Tax=Portunus trituberculatus TaxID=210409 RepID=A0A5B7EPN7_PORTR|nr:hypothetical protein [Portunus trituberculatus]